MSPLSTRIGSEGGSAPFRVSTASVVSDEAFVDHFIDGRDPGRTTHVRDSSTLPQRCHGTDVTSHRTGGVAARRDAHHSSPQRGSPSLCPQSSLKSCRDPERTQTPNSRTDRFSIPCCAPHRRWGRSTSPESVAGRPANNIQAGSGYKDHVVKPAEVRRNDAVGQAATIPYSRCHSQARAVADPKKNHRHSQRSWHPPEGHRAARITYESYETSFVIRNYFDAFLIQPVCCTYRRPLPDKPSSTCEESRDHVNSANWGGKLVCPYLLPRIVFSILPCIPSTAQRSMCELIFGKDQRDDNWPFTTSHKDVAVRIQPRHLSRVARSCRTTRHSPFLASAMLPFSVLFDHPRSAEPILNGLPQRICALTSSQHSVAPLPYTGAQQNLPGCGHARLHP